MRSLLLALSFCLFAASVWAGSEDRLIIAGAACIDSTEISLGQIARAEGEDAMLFLERRGSERVLPAPKFEGARMSVPGIKFKELLVQQFGAGLPRLEIPDLVQVQRGGQVVDGVAMRPDLDKILTSALQPFGNEIEIREYRIPDYLFVADQTPFRIRVSPVGNVGPGRINLRLEAVSANGKILQTFGGSVFANVFRDVPCAVRNLTRGSILDETMFTLTRKNLAFLPHKVWDGQSLPLRLAASVGEGQAIYADSVEPVPLVLRGGTLTLVYEGKTLRLSIPVESMQDGGVGQKIKVRNLQSRKIVVAKVVDKDTVQIP